MKVMIVSFQENSDVIGAKYLHAYITREGYQSSILLVPNSKPENVKAGIDQITKSKPDVLCFSSMTYEYERAKDFIKKLKEVFNDCPIIFGGIHASSNAAECLEVSDIVVRGEGEETLLELLRKIESTDKEITKAGIFEVKGIAFKQDNKIITTPVRQPMHALNELPFPRHIPEKMYVTHEGSIHSLKRPNIYQIYARYQGTFLSVLSSRGCPFSCHYCCNSVYVSLYGKVKIRNRLPQNVIDEIAMEKAEFGDNLLYVNFQDDCFMMNSTEWLTEFARLYKKEIGIPFIIRTTPKHINREKLVLLREAGLRWVFMGLQTGSDRVNREVYGRMVKSEEFLKAAKIVSELKLSCWYDVILDSPYETESEHIETIETLLKTPRPFQLDLFSLDFFPGTELRRRAIEEGISVPEPGTKSYTVPEPKMINRYIRMSATLSPALLRALLKIRKNIFGKVMGMIFYFISLTLEPFVYMWLIYNSNDYSIYRTMRVSRAFYMTAVSKLFLRSQG